MTSSPSLLISISTISSSCVSLLCTTASPAAAAGLGRGASASAAGAARGVAEGFETECIGAGRCRDIDRVGASAVGGGPGRGAAEA